MKKNNKGFVFMETIVVISVLSITLLMLFSSYSYILRKSRERDTFDTTETIYKTFYVKQIMDSYKSSTAVCSKYFSSNCTGVEYYIEQHMGNSTTKECSKLGNTTSYVCDLSSDSYSGYLKQVKSAFEVEKIYYLRPSQVLSSSNKSTWLPLFDATTIDYINQLDMSSDSYILVVKYKKTYNTDKDYEIFHGSITVK